MKKFHVHFYWDKFALFTVEAEDECQAEDMAWKLLEKAINKGELPGKLDEYDFGDAAELEDCNESEELK